MLLTTKSQLLTKDQRPAPYSVSTCWTNSISVLIIFSKHVLEGRNLTARMKMKKIIKVKSRWRHLRINMHHAAPNNKLFEHDPNDLRVSEHFFHTNF